MWLLGFGLGRVGSWESVLGWEGAQSNQEGRRINKKHGVEGVGSWNNVAGTFPPSLSPKIVWNTGVSSLASILALLPVLLVHAEGNQCWL